MIVAFEYLNLIWFGFSCWLDILCLFRNWNCIIVELLLGSQLKARLELALVSYLNYIFTISFLFQGIDFLFVRFGQSGLYNSFFFFWLNSGLYNSGLFISISHINRKTFSIIDSIVWRVYIERESINSCLLHYVWFNGGGGKLIEEKYGREKEKKIKGN